MARSDNDDGRRSDPDNSGDCDLLDLGSEPPTSTGRDSTLSPPVVSNHSIGTGRSRCRSRHRHHRRGRSRLRFKRKESNFLAAVCSMAVLVLLCTALAEPQWFYLRGGGCRDSKSHDVSYLGVNQFFYMGKFLNPRHGTQSIYQYGSKQEEVLFDCVTVQIVSIMKSIISLSFFGIVLSLLAFLLDLSGPTHKLLKRVRRHGILNILTVGFCVVINGFCYWATENLAAFQQATKQKSGSKVQIEFSISFFLVTAAGAMSVVAAACNLLRRHGSSSSSSSTRDSDGDNDRGQLLEDYDSGDFNPNDISQSLMCLPPPPPYSP